MSKVTLALGSFIVGACISLAASSLIHTSTRVHAQQAVLMSGEEPIVPSLGITVRGVISAPVQSLDGLNCEGCTITAPLITYAGGAFTCTGCSIHTSRVDLKGAALNTFNALRFFGAIPSPNPAPNKPKIPTLEAKQIQISPQENVNWVSLAGIQK
jgi:hypothetical protein